MRVDGPRGPSGIFAPRRTGGGRAAGSAPAATPQGPPVCGTGPLAAPAAILAIQEVDGVEDATARRTRAIRRGERLLDLLDGLRHGLLDGRIPAATLRMLRSTLLERVEVEEPELAAVLAEIDLRAAVELAKLERVMQADRSGRE